MAQANLIILGDLHVGDGETMKRHLSRGISRADQLPCLLDYYRRNPLDGRPWRLVITGDFIGFDEVTALPEAAELEEYKLRLDRERRRFGLGSGPAESAWKLRRIMAANPRIFQAFADFLNDGHELYIVSGNHDAPFFWPQVQEEFLAGLARVSGRAEESVARLRSRVRFHPWFYCEPGQLWVEHGHQFDPLNSFEYIGAPLHSRKNEIAPTTGSLGQRYLTNRVPEINPYAENLAGFWKYVRWAGRNYGWGGTRIVAYYLEAAFRVLLQCGRLRRRRLYRLQLKAEENWEKQHLINKKILRRLRRQHERPVLHSLRLTAAQVHLDKVLLLLLYFSALVYLLGLPLNFYETVAGAFALATSLYGAVELIGGGHRRLSREAFFKRGAKVAEVAGVRHVVFGHLHEPYLGLAGERFRVYGLGAWVSNQGGVSGELASAVIPSFVIVSGPPSQRRVVMYSWDNKDKRPVDGRELSRMEILAV